MTSNIIQGPTPIKKPAIWNGEPIPHVKRVIAIASGKGGVGKSTTAVNLALAMKTLGHSVGILDADIYGPSVPRMLGLSGQPEIKDGKMQPMVNHGIKAMSMGFITGDEAAILRGPMISKTLTQLLRFTQWGSQDAPLDTLFVDMPPGTGDIHLSMAQLVPLDGAIIVTTPQQVALTDARKCAKMFLKVNVKLLGVIENMSGGVFGSGGGKILAEEFGVPLLGTIPIDQKICEASDNGAATAPAQATYYNDIIKRL